MKRTEPAGGRRPGPRTRTRAGRRVLGRETIAALAAVLMVGGTIAARPADAQPPGGGRSGPDGDRLELRELAHRVVVQEAIDVLPKQIKKFYENHREEMPSQALDPVFPERGPDRRFLLDQLLPFPFKGLPRSEAALKAKFGEEAEKVGRLPWLVYESYDRLLEAYRAGDKARILGESDVLAGLMVDLNGPLNLTRNFDGQETGQHGLWLRLTERLPQAMGKDLKLDVDAANFLDHPREYVFSVMLESYIWVDNILYLDALARRGKGGYNEFFFDDFARRAGPILRERLSHAAEDAGSYWYTAWTAAGRPDLE
jgi:hypothetical protein